jgi:hypothetical protein
MAVIALFALAVALVGLVMNFARTPPEEASENLGQWLARLPRWERGREHVALFARSLVGRTLLGVLFLGALAILSWQRSNIEPSPNSPPPPTAPSAPLTPKTAATKTIAELMETYKGRTPLQAEPFIADQIGKWIDAEGKLSYMTPTRGAVQLLNERGILVQCAFDDDKWLPRLRTFRIGDFMRIMGSINRYQDGTKLALINCELPD